ncbi:mCpol domain-containing protein [Geitlerinema sp. CS-897]|nr:mCpol domain-containing protein [Geitlerinema sp. CS-897]
MKTNSFFVAIDGDLVGRKLEKLIVSNELDELERYSYSINESINRIHFLSETFNGKTYLKGGDSLLIELLEYQLFVEEFISKQSGMPTSFSVGIGRNAVEAYLALKFAKSAGRGLIVLVEVLNNTFEFKQIG